MKKGAKGSTAKGKALSLVKKAAPRIKKGSNVKSVPFKKFNAKPKNGK